MEQVRIIEKSYSKKVWQYQFYSKLGNQKIPDEDYNCTFGYVHGVGLEVRAMTDIKAGHEVLIQYGTRSDDELLLNYG